MKAKTFTLLAAALLAATSTTAQITVSGSGNTRTFTMPAYDVEVSTELYYKLSQTATDNAATYGTKTDVYLDRTLQAGGWNTFCAPFAISAERVTALGMTVKAFKGATLSGGTLTLNFEPANSIAAGTPYLVQVASELDLTADGKEFAGVTQNWTANTVTPDGSAASFIPVLVPENMTANDKTKLFIIDGSKLTFPNTTGNINAFRAYFSVPGAASARAFVMDFGDGEQTTGIIAVEGSRFTVNGESSTTYDLQGRKVENATKKGVYIQNGRKFVVK